MPTSPARRTWPRPWPTCGRSPATRSSWATTPRSTASTSRPPRGAPGRRRSTTNGSTRSRRPCCSFPSSTATRCPCWPRNCGSRRALTGRCPTRRRRRRSSPTSRARGRRPRPTRSGGCWKAISWAPLRLLDACGAAPDEAPPPPWSPTRAAGDARPLPSSPSIRAAGGTSSMATGTARPGTALQASPAVSPASAGGQARWTMRRPPPTSSGAAASASSRRAPAWARAWATCCRRPSPGPPPAAGSS